MSRFDRGAGVAISRSLLSAPMQIEREPSSGNVIRSFAAGEIRINDAVYTDPVILTSDAIIEHWSPADIAALSIADFNDAIGFSPEVILFGSGSVQHFPPPAVTTEILQRGIGFEVMDTAAAARTFNVLVGDGRVVAAALLLR